MSGRAPVTIALVQCKWRDDAKLHKAHILNGVKEAAGSGAQIVFLQELTLHRYFGDVHDKNLYSLAEVLGKGPTSDLCSEASKSNNVYVVGSLYERDEETSKLYNTAVIFNPKGELQFFTRKQHIPKGEGYDEIFYFEPGYSDYPVHDLGFIKLAVPTCYDQWFPEVARIYALKGAELIMYPTAIGSEPLHPGFNTQPMWQTMMVSHAIGNGVFVGAVNRIGNEGTVTFYGSSFVAAPSGSIIKQAARSEEEVVIAKLDFSTFTFWRELFPLMWQRQPQTYKRLLEGPSEQK